MSLPVAWERAVPGPQRDIGEHALFPQRVQVGQDAVGMGRLVEQRDVHGARAGAGFAVLMNGHRHGGFVWHLQGVTWNDLSYCSMTTRTGKGEEETLLDQQYARTYTFQLWSKGTP